MHILGLGNGSIHGNSEILLKAALKAAAASDASITISWIHVPSVVIPRNAKPIKIEREIIPNRSDEMVEGPKRVELDDREAVLNAILDADALIIASPVYSHQPGGTLKQLADAILGPYADVSEAYRTLEKKKAGDPSVKDVEVDPRQVKPRVAAFIAVAGSSPRFPEQWTMALPTMHGVVYCLHAKVIDQAVFPGYAHAGSVLTDTKNTVERAKILGQRVASQIGKPYDEALYLGPEEKGACPYCHLLKVEYGQGNDVRCITCGAQGRLVVDTSGDIRPVWEKDSIISAMTLKGKQKHRDDIVEKLNGERPKLPGISSEWEHWKNTHIPMVDIPSLREGFKESARL
ncbi:hypothetical protein Plec18167_004106 [Paecilomyces lecythidis]|uniref:NADPH-dependent FMN reductase-like domain-containing protein n=1 Tax=Paecilomyces lecythidis TaxID=3004212 RepID=A0ABR3XV90_9EURO